MQPTPERTRELLGYIPASISRDDWVSVAWAINSALPGNDGFALFDNWSSTAPEKYDPKEARAVWRRAEPDGRIQFGTLIRMAQERGYVVPKDDQPAKPPSAAELARQRKAADAARKAAADQRARENAAAAESARSLWGGAREDGAGDHPYLKRKGVRAYGLRVAPDGALLVPLSGADGILQNLQRIHADGKKRFLPRGRVVGLFHVLGALDNAAAILFTEGYATAASVHEATGLPVVVAFSASNLKRVGKALRAAHPAARFIFAGDEDMILADGSSNTGRKAATEAAALVQGLAVFPTGMDASGSDFNDLHQQCGIDAVREQIEAALATAPTPEPGATPAPRSDGHDPFVVNPKGTYFLGRDRDGRELAPLWLCSRLEVIARTRDTDGAGWGYLLSFSDPAGRPREWAMPARMLSGDGGEYRAALLNQGLQIATSSAARNRLTEYLQTRQPEALATCTERCGWHPAGDGAVYVLPDATIGETDERVVYQTDGATQKTFRQRGDASTWRERIGVLCVGNSRMVFTVAAMFAGPLLRPAGVDSGGFHFKGDSSSGKTTLLKLAASVNGAPAYMQRWRTTANALELTAAAHCDAVLILDELGQIDPREAGESAYMLSNEQSKGRASRSAALRPRLTWRLLFLSAGEIGLSDHMQEAGKRTRVGQEVRMVDIRADAGAGLGVFEDLHGRGGGAALADELARATAAVYGAPGLAWLEWMAAHWQGLGKRVRERMDALRASWVPEGASGQVQRVAQRFAIVAVAGELATEAELTGWPAGESERAVKRCFDDWLNARGGAGNAEVRQMLAQVKGFLEQHGSSRFTWWHRGADDRNERTVNRAGVRQMIDGNGDPIRSNSEHLASFGDVIPAAEIDNIKTDYYILPEVFRTEVAKGFDPSAVLAVLLQHGVLLPGNGERYRHKARLPGIGPSNTYHISHKIMGLDP